MSCISAPSIPMPDALRLLLGLDNIVLPIPSPDLGLCCKLPLPPIPPITIPLGAIPGIAIVLQPIMAVIFAIIDLLNLLLDQFQVSCPLD